MAWFFLRLSCHSLDSLCFMHCFNTSLIGNGGRQILDYLLEKVNEWIWKIGSENILTINFWIFLTTKIFIRFVQQHNSSSTSVRKTRAHFLIIGCWLIGTAIAGLPMVDGFGFASHTVGKFRGECHFTVVIF